MRPNFTDSPMIKNQLSPTYDEFYNWVTSGYKAKINIHRSKGRVVETNEIFTSLDIVMYGLELAYPTEFFKDPTILYSDNCVGEGAWLVGMALLRMKNGLTHEEAINNLRGIDIMIDNIDACRERLLCNKEKLRPIVEQNIYHHSKGALKFSYNFCPMTITRRTREDKLRKKLEKEKLKAQKATQENQNFERVFNVENSKKKINKPIANAKPVLPTTV